MPYLSASAASDRAMFEKRMHHGARNRVCLGTSILEMLLVRLCE